MFISKNTLSGICLIVFSLLFAFGGIVCAQTMTTKENPVIVLDAGHGGIDGGVTGVTSGVKESDLNLAVTLLLAEKLKAKNLNVVLTRSDENSIGKNKNEDMRNRKKIINNAKPDLVVSVHMNKFRDKSRRGAQVFFDDTKLGESFANFMQTHLNSKINSAHSTRKYEALGADLYLTKCYPCPSIIIECGFLSNSADEALLITPAYQDTLATTISDAISAYISSSF